MFALIDFDNLSATPAYKAQPHTIFHHLAQVLPASLDDGTGVIHARFYGGWRFNQSPSYSAQDFSRILLTTFPTAIKTPSGGVVRIKGELATDLLIDRGNVLSYTFRRNTTIVQTLRVDRQRLKCLDPQCPIRTAADVIQRNGICVKSTTPCAIGLDDVVYKNEQKIVDTAMVSDLQYISTDPIEKSVILISSDDDLFPGALAVLLAGKTVIHGNPLVGRSYQRLTSSPKYLANYKAYSL